MHSPGALWIKESDCYICNALPSVYLKMMAVQVIRLKILCDRPRKGFLITHI
ncbi:MAG: hypothetical protein KME59_15215 [Trichormus sp. ATA11-4-KO1]|nr:hypothetical protein [Trichormus sp. ATA11-4-KO1]